MLRQVFYFDRLVIWDKISIAVYVTLTAIFIYNDAYTNRDLLLLYTLGTQFLLYFLNYQSLRNSTVYLVWIFISLGHLFAYFHLRDNPELKFVRGHAATGLRNTIVLLLLYQILRIASLKIQGNELVAPSRFGNTDIFEGRMVTLVDIALSAVYFAMMIILNT